MRHRSFILLAALLMLLIFGSVAVYAVDAAQEDKIADGVTVAGVDVGGMSKAEARRAVAERVQEPLQKTIKVEYGHKTFKLTAEQAHARADVDAMIDEAVEASRKGNIVSRVTRNITGGKVNKEIDAVVVYDHKAVDGLVKRVQRKIERPATNAKVNFSGSGLEKVRGKAGITLNEAALQDAVNDELEHPTPDRVVEARVTKTKPKVGVDDLAGKYPVVVAVDRGNFKLRVYKKLKLIETYPIAVGQVGLETPAGLYHVQNKAVDPAWSVPHSPWAGKLAGQVIPGGAPNNPLKARWLGIYNGAGIHGTSEIGSLGSAASHGCIRMAVPDVIKVYDEVPVGAPVYIA
jgi:lipoprotein-anchoring transpeptidase ErfK/SrfK